MINRFKTYLIVQLANGEFVKDFQYSQGHFDLNTTNDVAEAMSVSKETFKDNFTADFGIRSKNQPSVVGSRLRKVCIQYSLSDDPLNQE